MNNCDEDRLLLLSSCVEQSSEGIAVSDLDGKLLFLNKAFANIHGYEPEKLIGKHLSTFHTPEQMVQVEKANAIVRKTGTFSGEIWHKHRDGHVFPTHMSNTLRYDDEGKPIGMIASLRDITELKDVENALRQSENHFRTIFRTGPDAISISRVRDGYYVDANDVFLAKTGYKRDEVIGHSSVELEVWNNPTDRVRLVKGLEKTGHVDNLEAIFKMKSGELVTGLMSARVIELDGEPHLIAVIRDITDRRRQQEALQESEEKFRHLAETTGAAIFIFQGEDNCYANPAAQTITGYSEEEIRTKKFWELIHPDHRDLVRARGMARQQSEDVPTRYAVKILTKSGETRYVEYTGAQIIFQGKPAVLGTAFDITAREVAGEKLRKTTEELQKERKALTEKNVALKQILDHIEQERLNYKDTICRQIDDAIRPFLSKLNKILPDDSKDDIEGLKSTLDGILAKDVDVYRDNYRKLTPREIEICELIKEGKSSKQMSSILNLSLLTIHKHREQIREKLGLTNKNVNLSSFLQSH